MSEHAALSEQTTPKPNRFREIGGLLALFFGAVLFLALVSHHPNDPSWSVMGSGTARNALGSLGAHLSDVMFQFFGNNAYIIAAICLLCAFALLMQRRLKLRLISVVGYVCMGLFSAGLWHLFVGQSGTHSAGGVWGQWLAESLRAHTGTLGASLLLMMAIVLAIVWTTQFSFLLAAQHLARRCEPRFTAWWLRQQEKMMDWRDSWDRWRGRRQQRPSSYMPVTDSQFVVADGLQSELPALELDGAWLDGHAETFDAHGAGPHVIGANTGRYALPRLAPPENDALYREKDEFWDGMRQGSSGFWDDSTDDRAEEADGTSDSRDEPGEEPSTRILAGPNARKAEDLADKRTSKVPLAAPEDAGATLFDEVPYDLPSQRPDSGQEIALSCVQEEQAVMLAPCAPAARQAMSMQSPPETREELHEETREELHHAPVDTLPEGPHPLAEAPAQVEQAAVVPREDDALASIPNSEYFEMMGFLDSMEQVVASEASQEPTAADVLDQTHEQPTLQELPPEATFADATNETVADPYENLPPLSFHELAAIASPDEARTLVPTQAPTYEQPHIATRDDRQTLPATGLTEEVLFEAAPEETLVPGVATAPEAAAVAAIPVEEVAPVKDEKPAKKPRKRRKKKKEKVLEALGSNAPAPVEAPAADEAPVALASAPASQPAKAEAELPALSVPPATPTPAPVVSEVSAPSAPKAAQASAPEVSKPAEVAPAPKATKAAKAAKVAEAAEAAKVVEVAEMVEVSTPAPEVVKETPAPKVVEEKAAEAAPTPKPAPAGLVGVAAPEEKEEAPASDDKPLIKERVKAAPNAAAARPKAPKKLPVNYEPPGLDLLDSVPPADVDEDLIPEHLIRNAEVLEQTLENFGVRGKVKEILPGPVITLYEYLPEPGIKVSKIANLADDLAMALHALQVRVIAPIPGKGVVGIELPNKKRENVYLREILEDERFQNTQARLPLVMGKDTTGQAYVANLAKMPHCLIAGTTGSGKSVGVNGMICSLLYHHSPEDVRFLMIDPKMLELSIYDGIPHLLLPVVTDPKQAAVALAWAVNEMERRYQLMAEAGVRNIINYNRMIEKRVKTRDAAKAREEAADQARREAADIPPEDISWEDEDSAEFDLNEINPDGAPRSYYEKLPYIVVIIDELADLMMVAAKEVEFSIARLAQMARAAGLHLLLATQRPSVDVLTGVIKANFPSRLAFQVKSKIDSRTILDQPGAEKLLGMGDMLLVPPGAGSPVRLHGAFVSEEEIHRIVAHLKKQGEPDYNEEILAAAAVEDEDADESVDAMYDQAVEIVLKTRNASISHLQRKLRIGYNRAARIVEFMEREGLVGAQVGNKPREVLVPPPTV